MEWILYIMKIILFFVFVSILYFVAKKDKNTGKIKIINIIICCILFGVYSYIITKYPYIMDKKIYALKFSSDIYESQVFNDSIGLWVIQKILHIFTYNPRILFFCISFLYLFITLIAYNKIEKKSSCLFIILLGLSGYLLYGFYMIKQCIAISFVAIAFSSFINKNYIKTILFLMIAVLFHESALIMIPLFLALTFSSNSIVRFLEYVLLILCLIFFPQINYYIIKIVVKLVPTMERQLSIYVNNGYIENISNKLTIIKGLPFYFITLCGLINRKKLKEKIDNYDFYLLCSFFVSITILLSYFMYWMFRFGIYCYFPTLIFASLLFKNIQDNKKKSCFALVLIVSFFALILKDLVQYYFIYGGM